MKRMTQSRTPPEVTTSPSTPGRQRLFLAFGLVLIAALSALLVLLDRQGTSRQENRGRSNETQLNNGGAGTGTNRGAFERSGDR
jgi:hypothetical protein